MNKENQQNPETNILEKNDIEPLNEDEMTREVTEKPGERNTSPIIPAYCNFQVARKMHVENLEHQPLPDSIMDKAYRKLQAQGSANPELALDVYPVATGTINKKQTFFFFIISCFLRCWSKNIYGWTNPLH